MSFELITYEFLTDNLLNIKIKPNTGMTLN